LSRSKKIKKFIEDIRNFLKGEDRKASSDPRERGQCTLFKFCEPGYGFLLSIADLDEGKINVEGRDAKTGIITLNLEKISNSARQFLKDESFVDFHNTLQDYAESANYVGVLNHILSSMAYFDFWLEEIVSLSEDCPKSCIGLLKQLAKFLPAIYSTDKDPYGGGFRGTKIAKEFFCKEAEKMLVNATDLLKAGSVERSCRIVEALIRRVVVTRSKLMREYKIALDTCISTGEELREYSSKT